ncbi:MAG TPA: N-formylglutamate deformylase, partial [Burkholderiaceae bacterium]|nr:N-formylglutamate deformylase [Burkholderiaceae bacterium]
GLRDGYVERALRSEDTDWHLERLYAFARDMGASVLKARISRYVIDLNRPPDDTPMYPGAQNTELCPTRFFTGEPLYREGHAPSPAEIAHRRSRYWQPYHDALLAEIDRLRERYGHVVVFDAHSIQSELPWLFEGRLPDLNLGTADGESCAPGLRHAAVHVLQGQTRFSHVVDGRFKGGYITRHYGRPHDRVHVLQLEKVQSLYMDERRGEGATFAYDEEKAQALQPLLRTLLSTLMAWRPDAN